MHTCGYLMPDDYECNDVATVKVGRRWFCADHAHVVETGEVPDEFDFEDEEKGYVPYEE